MHAQTFERIPTNCACLRRGFVNRKHCERVVRLQCVNGSLQKAIRTVCSSTVRKRFVTSTEVLVEPNKGHAVRLKVNFVKEYKAIFI